MDSKELEETLWYRLRDLGRDSYWSNLSVFIQNKLTCTRHLSSDFYDDFVIVLLEVLDERT